ncbi:MAG TPA: ATP-binding protein [Vicinamibacteria bacterium]|nr:ATP-binding protein [Vicinamibacteria bacterium]
MSHPTILCVRGEEDALRDLFPDHDVTPIGCLDEARALFLGTPADRKPIAVVVGDRPITLPPGSEARVLVSLLLERNRLCQRVEEMKTDLEVVSGVGVSLAESFDISEILSRAHQATSDILNDAAVEIFYAGRRSIRSRPMWHPATPSCRHLSTSERRRLGERIELIAESATGRKAAVDSLADRVATKKRRGTLPLAHGENLYGVLFFDSSEEVPAERLELASVLALQAATALRNIHLAQERIHFERLSAVGRMVGSVIHDFRGPLTALSGYAGMLSELDVGEDERREYADAMKDECDRLSHMVDELLELTRGHGSPMSSQPVPLTSFLTQLADRIRHRYRGEVLVEVDAGFSGDLCIDRRRMERAFWNIVTNACQAMSGRGVLRIRSWSRAPHVVVEVEDQGPGIASEIRHRLFEPFFSYGKSQGIGLGLATAKRIAEEHGGEVQIESHEGRGTIVRFVLAGEPGPEAAAVDAHRSTGSLIR